MKKIALICVNYNNSNYTKLLVNSVESNKFDNNNLNCLEIYVVDNSDTVLEREKLILELGGCKNVLILYPQENVGYFHGINFALKNLALKTFDFIIIGNNDLVYSESFLSHLISSKYPLDCMVLCPNLVTKAGQHQNPHHTHKFSKLQIMLFDLYFTNYFFAVILSKVNSLRKMFDKRALCVIPDKVIEIYQGVGACYVLMPSFFCDNSELYFPGFLYGEEACLSHQVNNSGGKLYFDPGLLVTHDESATLSKLPSRKTYQFGRESYWKFREILNYEA
jgi:GT2 family glycosyltransferase